MTPDRRTLGSWVMAGALLIAGAHPLAGQDTTAVQDSAAAQEASAADALSAAEREELTRFARAHVQLNAARDEFHGQVARVHDPEGRLRAREEVDARITEILAEHELTHEQYDDFILQISLDGNLRAAFDEIVAELTEGTASN